MRKAATTLFCAIVPLFAWTDEDPALTYSYWDIHPLHIGGNLLRLGKAPVDSNDNGHLYFRKSNAYLSMLVPINRHNFFFPRVEFNAFTLDWNQNPKFNETHFYYAQFGLTFYTTGLEQWRWILRADYNLDLEHFSQPGAYGYFSLLMWGKYELHKKWHYHVGAMGSVGLESHTVYPIIGIDFAPNQRWTFEAIFPIVYSVQYNLNKNWRFSIKGRPLKERFRVGTNEPQPRSVFNYSSIGTEFNVHYEQFLWLEIEAYIGYNFGGNFYIKNQSGHNALYTEVGGSPYAGVSLDYGF